MKKNYFFIFLVVLGMWLGGSIFTSSQMEWYKTLILPTFVPPGFVIGIVWTILYILIAIAAILIWKKTSLLNWKKVFFVSFFLLNAFLNFFWSFLFFGKHLILVSFIEMILLNITTLVLIILSWKETKIGSILLWPYFIWVSFATFLTYKILLLNS